MALFQPAGNVENIARNQQKGDTHVDTSLVTTVNSTAALAPIPGRALAGGIVLRTGTLGGATNDTTPDATTLVNLFASGDSMPSGGMAWRVRYINVASSQTVTLVGGTGVTVSGTATIANNTWREFIFEFVSAKLSFIGMGNTTNGSPTVQMTFQDNHNYQGARIEVGMTVTGTGIQAGTTVIGITPEAVITLSQNANATGTGTTLTFGPAVTVTNVGAGTV